MPIPIQTTENALNGQELKDIIKIKLERIVDSIPLLRVGTTFKHATLEFGFSMKAYPADIPTPDDIDLEFEINPAQITEEEKTSVENIKKFVNKLIDQRDEVVEKFENEIEKYCTIVEKGEAIKTSEKPDETRIEVGLKVPILTEESGRKVEVGMNSEDLQIKGGKIG